jgi:hypothetical protein
LVRSDAPTRSDAIVLFAGADFVARKQEALKLMQDGYARYLIIPEHGAVLEAPIDDKPGTNKHVTGLSNYPEYFENTHIEILEAKKTIDKIGLKSAIFVSSPYHMRRISIIAREVFGRKGYRLTFVPSRYEPWGDTLWILTRQDFQFTVTEYSKIIWFMMYWFLPQTAISYANK